ncbi:hypothetical protein DIPPA_21917 [Diplonema papillatum]|nr:hypothetical protein DIPPA_21917 [Diplonema papillatum]
MDVASLETYPEFDGLGVMQKEWGIDESISDLQHHLDNEWWAVIHRTTTYSPHSDSYVTEVFMLIKKPYSPENFKCEANGNIVCIKAGRKQLVHASSTPRKIIRRFVILDSPPVKAFYLRYMGDGFRAFRFSVDLCCAKDTRNKLDVQQYMQNYLNDMHPVYFPSYFGELVESVKARDSDQGEELHSHLRAKFRQQVMNFKRLQAREIQEREEAALRKRVLHYGEDSDAMADVLAVSQVLEPQVSVLSPSPTPHRQLFDEASATPQDVTPHAIQPPPNPPRGPYLPNHLSTHSENGYLVSRSRESSPAPGETTLFAPAQLPSTNENLFARPEAKSCEALNSGSFFRSTAGEASASGLTSPSAVIKANSAPPMTSQATEKPQGSWIEFDSVPTDNDRTRSEIMKSFA